MMLILAATRSRYEFKVAHAINGMGALASVPRRVEWLKDKDGKPKMNVFGKHEYDYRPILPGLIFCAMEEDQWHAIMRNRLFADGAILPPIRHVLDILPRTWADCEGFAHRAEIACGLRLEQYEAGLKVARYKRGDLLRIVGHDLITGQLSEKLAHFVRVNSAGNIEVQDGSQMMGKEITRQIEPGRVIGLAAE